MFSDSDVYKWTEAVGSVLPSGDRPELRATTEKIIDEVVAVQEPNGYLNTYYQDDRKSLRMLTQTQTTGRQPAEQFQSEFRKDLLGGMIVLHHEGAVYERGSGEKVLYSQYKREPSTRKVPLTFIPYYAWANRQATFMQVWNLLLQT